ncbi:MAG: hypothetical protein IPO32_19430 [Crocinitomicaceae bacterium]|nr:hypothetical protein [Crocinitomicaceae bacterium]
MNSRSPVLMDGATLVCGQRFLEAAEESILANNQVNELEYISGAGPLKIIMIDPLNLQDANFELYFQNDLSGDLDSATWYILKTGSADTVFSDRPVSFSNEQLIPEWGISVIIEQTEYVNGNGSYATWRTSPIDAKITFADSSKIWLSGIQDDDNYYPTNWIRSGTYTPTPEECIGAELNNPYYYPDKDLDGDQEYEKLLEGTVTPFKLVGTLNF